MVKDIEDMAYNISDQEMFDNVAKKTPTKPKNKGGRPRGSKNKPFEIKYKKELETFEKDCNNDKTDRWKATMQESSKFVNNAMILAKLPRIDLNYPDSVQKRVSEYFQIVMENNLRPSLAGLALAFHINRGELSKYINGNGNICGESREILKQAYRILNALMEDYMGNSAIDKTLAIFLSKNNFGYKDQQDVVYQNTTTFQQTQSKEEIRNKYMLDMVDAEVTRIDDTDMTENSIDEQSKLTDTIFPK